MFWFFSQAVVLCIQSCVLNTSPRNHLHWWRSGLLTMSDKESEKEKGNAAFRNEDYTTALKHYDQAIKNAGTGAVAALFSNKAAALQKLEKYDLCIEQCLTGLAAPGLTPELKSKINFRMVLAYEAQGRFEEAIEACEKCGGSPTVLEKQRELFLTFGRSQPEAFYAFFSKEMQNARAGGADTDAFMSAWTRRRSMPQGDRSRKLNRNELIAEHNQYLKFHKEYMQSMRVALPVRFDTLNSATSGHVSIAALSALEPITIDQMRLDGEINAGKMLICRTIAEPLLQPGLKTLIEDPLGAAARLTIYNLRSPTNDGIHLMPIGVYLAIKEPWYETGASHTVRVDNPANIVYLAQSHSLLSSLTWQTVAPEFRSGPATVESLQKRGDELLAAGNPDVAVAIYTDAIELKREVAPHELADLLAARAAAYLAVDKPTDAFSDCQSALRLDPDHLKAALRMAKTHAKFEEYKKAKEDLEKSLHTTRPEFQAEISQLNLLLREQQNGDYDLKALLKEAAASETPRFDHASYNGGVCKKWVSQEKGNGLIALREFAPGDLLFVEKAFETAFTPRCNTSTCETAECDRSALPDVSNISLTDILNAKSFMAGALHNECVSRIFGRISKHTDLIEELYQLFAGPDFVRLDNSGTNGALAVDIKRVAAIVNRNAFGYNAFDAELFGPGRPTMDLAGAGFVFDGCGVWILASSMNHSCAPNTVVFYVGDLMIVRAAKNIREGEELTTSYTSQLALEYTKRQEACMKFGFKCECELCVCDLERIGSQPELDEQRQAFMDSFDKLRDQLHEAVESESIPLVVKLTENVRQRAEDFSSRLSYKDRHDASLGRLYAAVGYGYNGQREWLKAAQADEQAYFAAVGNQGNTESTTFVNNTLPLDAFIRSYNTAKNSLRGLDFDKAKEYLGKMRQAAKICWGSDDRELLEMLHPGLPFKDLFEALF